MKIQRDKEGENIYIQKRNKTKQNLFIDYFTTNTPNKKIPFYQNHLSNNGLYSQVKHWEQPTRWGISGTTGTAQTSGHCRARRGLNLQTGDKRSWEALQTTIWNQARKKKGASEDRIPTHCSPPRSEHFSKTENTPSWGLSPTSFLHPVFSSEEWAAWIDEQWFLTFSQF